MNRGSKGRFRCDECHKVFPVSDGGEDLGESHWFCWRCLDRIENHQAIVAARIERKHGVVISSHAAFFLAE